jgi:DNA-binding transcriptional LysR family regulator
MPDHPRPESPDIRLLNPHGFTVRPRYEGSRLDASISMVAPCARSKPRQSDHSLLYLDLVAAIAPYKQQSVAFNIGSADPIEGSPVGRLVDTELARTFLAVVATGHFVAAADRLHVTQSTVSARIQALEQQLDCRLFVRNKAGTVLTPAGKRFQKHASSLVRTVEQARQDVGIPSNYRAILAVGGRIGLWENLLLQWLPLMREMAPDVSVRAEVSFEEDLMQRLIEGRIDIGVMYTPQNRPGLHVELLIEDRLVFVSSSRASEPKPGPGYVYIDWGPEFFAKHSASFPDFVSSGMTVNIGWLGLQYILENGGSGYFPMRLVRPYLEEQRFHLIREAPEFSNPAYVVYSTAGDVNLIAAAVVAMRQVASNVA